MSIEISIQENTAALLTVAELLRESNAGRAEALAAAASISTDTKAAKAPKAPKPAAEPAPAPAPAGPPTLDDVRAAFGAYLGVDDPTEKESRKATMVKILAKFGVGKATEIAEKDRAQAITWAKTLTAGKDVPELEDEAEEDDMLG